MFAKSLYILPVILSVSLIDRVAGVDMRGYSNSNSCSDSFFACRGFNAGACCTGFPAAFGYSVEFTDLPLGSQGSIFGSDNCATLLTAVFGEGNKCWSGGGLNKMRSLSWGIQRARRENQDSAAECSAPNRFAFVNDKGEKVQIHVPKGQADNISALFLKKDFKGLGQFQKVNLTAEVGIDL